MIRYFRPRTLLCLISSLITRAMASTAIPVASSSLSPCVIPQGKSGKVTTKPPFSVSGSNKALIANILAPLLLEAEPLQDGLMGPSFDFDRRMTRNFGEPGAKVNDGVFRAFGESASLLPEPPLQ